MKPLTSLVAGLLALVLLPARAQLAGSVDPAFTTAVASVSGGTVNAVLVEPDGQILIAGSFNFVGGVARKNIARLESTGVLDPTFDPGSGANGEVFCLALQSDGRILIGGNFTSVNTQACGRIARLSDMGVVEGPGDFDPGSGANGDVRSIAVQPSDGHIVVGGGFTSINTQPRGRIARLEPNGNVEPTGTFNPGTGTGGFFGSPSRVWAVALQPSDGKILIGGSFFTVNGQTNVGLARLESTGVLDTTFNPGIGFGGEVRSIALDGGGKILIGGSFSTVNSVDRGGFARLDSNGTLEAFSPGTGAMDGALAGTVLSLAVEAGGKVVVGGTFTSFNGQACGGIARLDDVTGTVETSLDFNPGVGAGGSFSTPSVNSVAVQPVDGKILAGGDFRSMAGQLRRAIARLHPTGVYDHGFTPGTLANSINDGLVNACAVQPDGKVLIGGNFNLVGGQARSSIARLNADGSVEDTETFDVGTGTAADSPVFAIAVQADGKIVIGGQFDGVDGLPRYRLARLHPDGAVESDDEETGFHPVISPPGQVNCIAIQPNGSILIGGDFERVGEESHNGIARLLPNGDLDPSFNLGTGATGSFGGRVYSIAVQPDGYIVVGGDFTAMNDAPRSGIARLKGDGTLDPDFIATGVGSSSSVNCVVVDPQGQILIGGDFTTVNGVASGRIARLNGLDGSLDGNFSPGTGANSTVTGIGLQADGKIVLTGPFTTIDGAGNPRPKIARLLPTGNVEPLATFDPGSGADGFPGGVTLQADGKILITGEFATFNGDPHVGIARLHNDPATATLSSPGSGSVQWLRGGSSPEVGHVTFELSTNGGTTWTPLGAGTYSGGTWQLTGLNLPGSGLVRARGRTTGGNGNGSAGRVGQQVSLGAVLTPYQQWKQLHLDNPAAPDLDDPDFDGVVTLVEYGLNTLPQVPGGSVIAPSVFAYAEGRRLRIFVPRNPDHNDITVEVRAADDLAGPWTTIATSALGTPFSGPGYFGGDSATPSLKTVEIRDVVDVADKPRRFLHVRVTP